MLKNFLKAIAVFALAASAFAQTNTLSATTTSTATLATDSVINLTSVSAVNVYSLTAGTVGSQLYVVSAGQPRGEVMIALSVSGNAVRVRRGEAGARTGIPTGATVLVGAPNLFYNYDPSGSCSASTVFVSPWVNTGSGFEWLCSTVTGTWVPGWNNPGGDAFAPTAAVASAAGLITPSGPLFHVTGTAAITGFNIPVGFTSGSFTVIPDGIFTTTTANNIALGSTAVVSKPITFTYDPATAKFYPSY
jgi:hypothetical protein